MQQILTYAGLRDKLEEMFEKISELKSSVRRLQLDFTKAVRQDAIDRVAAKKAKMQKEFQKHLEKKDKMQKMLTNGTKLSTIEDDAEEEVDDDVKCLFKINQNAIQYAYV